MAILFSCPYCTASVKVPDSASGKLGACPKCGTKIRIPTVAIPPATAAQPPTPISMAPVVQATVPAVAPPPPPSVSADPFDFSAAAAAMPAPVSTPTRKKPAPRKPLSPVVMIGIAVALLAMAGTAIAIYIKNLPVYQGTVPGVRVPTGNTITVTALWSDLEITPQTQLPVIEYFKRHKTSLANNLLKIEMSATPAGLVVRFETTDESMLIGVDPQLLPDVKKLIDQNKATWNESRKRELTQYAQEMCANIVKAQAGGTRVESLSMYRDSVALNALVRGLGRHCVAQATKSSHSCVFEDEEGKLYFVVPQLTSEIAVQEKMMEGRPRVLPPGFQIWATIPASTAATPHIEPPEPEEPAPATDDKQPKTEKPGAETEGETPPTDGEMKPEKAGDGKMMKPGMEKMMKK